MADLVRLATLTAVATLSRDGVMGEPFSLVLDQHKRNRRDRHAGMVGREVADEILSRSSAKLDDDRGLDPLSDADLMAALAAPLRSDL